MLHLRLQGPAREVLRSLPAASFSSVSDLLTTLRARFLSVKRHEVKRSAFRLRTQAADETPLTFGNALRGLAAQAFPTMEADQRDLLTRDQFLDGLRDASVRLRVRYGTPKSLDDVVRIALEISAAEMAEQRSTKSSHTRTPVPQNFTPPLIATATHADAVLKTMEQQSSLLASIADRLHETTGYPSFAVPTATPYQNRPSVPVAQSHSGTVVNSNIFAITVPNLVHNTTLPYTRHVPQPRLLSEPYNTMHPRLRFSSRCGCQCTSIF